MSKREALFQCFRLLVKIYVYNCIVYYISLLVTFNNRIQLKTETRVCVCSHAWGN